MKTLSPASISTSRATIDVSPSTFRRKRLARPPARVTVLRRTLSSVRLYTVSIRVGVPTVVNTVSKATVSAEKSSFAAPSSVKKPSLSHETDIHGSKPKTIMYKNLFICLKNSATQPPSHSATQPHSHSVTHFAYTENTSSSRLVHTGQKGA